MLELTVRLVVSLAVVVGLLLVLARFGARKFRGNSAALVHVVHRQPLSRTSAVAVVTVGTRVLVLGTTEQQVSVLAELDPDELDLDDLDLEATGATITEMVPALVLADEPALALADELAASPARSAGGSHRAAPRAGARAGSRAGSHSNAVPSGGALAGSVLSPATWRQAFNVATSRGQARSTSRRAS